MFNKKSINKCNTYMYLEYTKSAKKEEFILPKAIDFFTLKSYLIEYLNPEINELNKVYSFDEFITKIDLIKNNNYYMFSFNKSFIKDIQKKKMQYDKEILRLNDIFIDKFYFVRLNENFVKNGKINLSEIFIIDEILLEDDFNILEFKKAVTNEPKVNFSPSCKKCPYIKHCVKNICDFNDSIFSLSGKIDSFLKDNTIKISDCNKSLFSKEQLIQVEEKEIIDKEYIKNFILSLKFPINFIDFEKANLYLPIYEGDKLNSGFFFQYSLDVMDENYNVSHYDCVIESLDELNIINNKLENELKEGSVVCYNTATEMEAINTLIKQFPNSLLKNINHDRFKDMSKIFKEYHYYNPLMKGKTSIKNVLPALTDKSYDDFIDVKNGIDAASSFTELISLNDENEKEILIKKMKDYCNLDTFAMVLIYKKLLDIIK